MPVFEQNTLAQAAAYLSNELRKGFLIDDVESLIVEGHLVACLRHGEQLKFIFGDSYRRLKNGGNIMVAESKGDLENGMETDLKYYEAIEFKPDHVVLLKAELDEFIASAMQREAVHTGRFKPTRPVQRTRALQDTILDAIANLGVDALAVPRNKTGQPGVRRQVWEQLQQSGHSATEHTFKKAWQALRNSGNIRTADTAP